MKLRCRSSLPNRKEVEVERSILLIRTGFTLQHPAPPPLPLLRPPRSPPPPLQPISGTDPFPTIPKLQSLFPLKTAARIVRIRPPSRPDRDPLPNDNGIARWSKRARLEISEHRHVRRRITKPSRSRSRISQLLLRLARELLRPLRPLPPLKISLRA